MKERVIALIEHENPKNPLANEEIAKKLRLNRKTVTTFHQEAGIPGPGERKKPVLMAKMRGLTTEQPSISDRGLIRLLEDDGFAVGRHVVRKLAEDIHAELTGKSMDDAGAFPPSEYAGNTGYMANTDGRHLSGKGQNPSAFRNFIGYDGSLMGQVSQAQTAILYPPKSLHCLLHGPSGAGKSYLTGLMHSLACGTENFGENPPYFAFNCTDYADNPQLLLAQLSGYNKGNFTGADGDREGAVEMCNDGILSLGEIHRLPSEGQEILFYLTDKGEFRRLGEVDAHQESRLMVIAATTENPQSSLLLTFRRRTPIIIEIPPLKERPPEERLEPIRRFSQQKSSTLGQYIVVKKEVL